MLLLVLALGASGQIEGKTITYSGQVARIIQRNCQECHHPGAPGPFSLLTHDDAVKWADSIREAVAENRMPPWFADPRYGKFSNDRRLNEEDKQTLLAWIDSNREQGDPRLMPPGPPFVDGWTIGQPDVVFELPQEQDIPASGEVPYRCFSTPTNFTRDVWIQAAEVRPSNRAAVHHVNVAYAVNSKDPRLPFAMEVDDGGFLLGGVPGDWSWTLPPGQARKILAGSSIYWQVHYITNGKPMKDRTQIGLIFYKGKKPPKCSIHTIGLMNYWFSIPPHDANYPVEIERQIPKDMQLLALNPHMHVRGKDFEYKAIYPDGKTETLLFVPKYDFNWQLTYKLERPLLLPKGTTLRCTAHYDNSSANPANPDPTQTVHWGDQSTQEMMIGFINVFADDNDLMGSGAPMKNSHRRIFLSDPFLDPKPRTPALIRFFRDFPLSDYWYLCFVVPFPLALGWLLLGRRRNKERLSVAPRL